VNNITGESERLFAVMLFDSFMLQTSLKTKKQAIVYLYQWGWHKKPFR
jgi:hypothetical protein